MQRVFTSPDGGATVTCDAGMFKDTWTLFVDTREVAREKVSFLAQLSVGSQMDTNGWGGFELSGSDYGAIVLFHPRTREVRVLFRLPGQTWDDVEQLAKQQGARRV